MYLMSLFVFSIAISLVVGTYQALGLDLRACCGEFEGREASSSAALDLAECVKAQSEDRYADSLHAAVPFLSPQRPQGPTLAVAILSRATENVYAYAAYGMFIQATHARNNGYIYLPSAFYPDEDMNDDYRYHRKLSPIIEALSAPVERKVERKRKHKTVVMTGGEAYFSDYLVWMDADAVPLNMSFRFEKLAASYPQAHILASKDSSSMINTGVMIVKNSEWALEFLRDWRDMKDGVHDGEISHPPASTDQAGFAATFSVYEGKEKAGKIPSSWRSKIAILEVHELNSILPAFSRQEPSHNVLHLAAESETFRATVMRKGAMIVCDAQQRASEEHIYIAGKRALWPDLLTSAFDEDYAQLGLSRHKLMATAISVYGREAGASLLQLRKALGFGFHASNKDKNKNGECIREIRMSVAVLSMDLGRLRTAVGKYCHALPHAASSSSPSASSSDLERRALGMRQAAYRLVAEWVGVLQKMVDMQQEYLSRRERSGVSSSSRGSGLQGGKDGDPKAYFTHRPTHAPDEHPGLARLLPVEVLRELGETEEGTGEEESLKDKCTALGRAPTVLVKGYLGCAQLKSFENPESRRTQHSYCVASKIDLVLERISENMKLSAELAFDYLVALSSATDEQILALSGDKSIGDSSGAIRQREKEELSSYLTALLSSLLVSVHPSQRIIVADMSAGLLLQLAEMTLRDMQAFKNRLGAASTVGAVGEETHLGERRKAVGYLEEALQLYLGMQDGRYSAGEEEITETTETRSQAQSKVEHDHLSPSLSSHGVDLRAVTSAASSLGSLYCEDGRHDEGLTLHYRAVELDAYYQGYHAGPSQGVSEGSLLLIPHLHNVAACKRSAVDSPLAGPEGLPPLSLELPIEQWRLQERSHIEVLALMMAMYSEGFRRDLDGVDRYRPLAESGASQLASIER